MKRWQAGLMGAGIGILAAGYPAGPAGVSWGAERAGLFEAAVVTDDAEFMDISDISGLSEAFAETELSDDELEQQLESLIDEMSELSGWSDGEIEIKTVAAHELKPVFNQNRKLMQYTLPNQTSFFSNVPLGMITSQPVLVEVMENALVTASCNGKAYDPFAELYFTDPGFYQVEILSFQPQGDARQDYNMYRTEYVFQIIQEVENKVSVMTAPPGFEIRKVIKNGREVPLTDTAAYFADTDGRYEISYTDRETGGIDYAVSFTRDTSAPFLEFSEEPDRRGYLAGPVELYASEPDSILEVSYNGNTARMVNHQLDASGFYLIKIRDQSGNERSYSITVEQKNHETTIIMVIIAFLVAGGLLIRVIYLRGHMKVL